MHYLVGIITDTTLVETELLVAFLLCSLIGLERQMRQKAAGFRTHVLVGMGSCAFTLVSVFGFSSVLGEDVVLDPSRIAAQIVSGIGFLGAGVIFKGRSVVRGLTTAATIWVAAAVGMACGAGMLSLAILLTALHLLTLFVVAPLVRRLPSPDSRRQVRITYADGAGVLLQRPTSGNVHGLQQLYRALSPCCRGGSPTRDHESSFPWSTSGT